MGFSSDSHEYKAFSTTPFFKDFEIVHVPKLSQGKLTTITYPHPKGGLSKLNSPRIVRDVKRFGNFSWMDFCSPNESTSEGRARTSWWHPCWALPLWGFSVWNGNVHIPIGLEVWNAYQLASRNKMVCNKMSDPLCHGIWNVFFRVLNAANTSILKHARSLTMTIRRSLHRRVVNILPNSARHQYDFSCLDPPSLIDNMCLGKLFHDVSRRVVTLNGGLIRELPQNPLNSGLGIILICPDVWIDTTGFLSNMDGLGYCCWKKSCTSIL